MKYCYKAMNFKNRLNNEELELYREFIHKCENIEKRTNYIQNKTKDIVKLISFVLIIVSSILLIFVGKALSWLIFGDSASEEYFLLLITLLLLYICIICMAVYFLDFNGTFSSMIFRFITEYWYKKENINPLSDENVTLLNKYRESVLLEEFLQKYENSKNEILDRKYIIESDNMLFIKYEYIDIATGDILQSEIGLSIKDVKENKDVKIHTFDVQTGTLRQPFDYICELEKVKKKKAKKNKSMKKRDK